MFYTNARSIIQKRDELVAYVTSEQSDIISITETWININDKHLISEVNIPGYTIFLDCRENRRGGGVILYIKDSIDAIEINKNKRSAYESVYVKIKVNRKRVIIGTIYRPPKTTIEDDQLLYEELESVIKTKNSIIC